MAAHTLSVERESDGPVEIVRASGELDLATAAMLCRAITVAGEGRRPRVLVDLAAVEFCDSAGLRALLGAAKEIEVRAGRMVGAVDPGGLVDRLLQLAGLRDFLRFYPPDEARLRV